MDICISCIKQHWLNLMKWYKIISHMTAPHKVDIDSTYLQKRALQEPRLPSIDLSYCHQISESDVV